MATDFSRVRSNPLLDFAGVELKQGGVVLDADLNEWVAIADRRLRAATSDILGRATVSSTTPDALRISAIAGGLRIGRGRLYVDGLLAENHGAASDDPAERGFDPLLAEPVYTEDIDYAAQPYLPQPPDLPTGRRHLVYLDVWQREVTHLERPDLVESAVGVETSSRLQTVWQVRVLPRVGTDATCTTPDGELTGWADLIAPSTGRLTTGTFEVPAASDPCELPPTGGYRGLENQLYRVEIHDPGQPGGTATFKWSRDNASVGSRVASMISATELELDSIGRDEVLRFSVGDWIAITDDAREFSQRCGEMRRITDIDDATRRIRFATALPVEMLPSPPDFPDSEHPRAANLRVRRWDQNGRIYRTDPSGNPVQIQDLDASTDGLIDVPVAGVEVILENGVTVSFASVGTKGFRAGDWWAFAARTTDASVELLEQAPPRGIHHHYARLAIWDSGSDADPADCRTHWPPFFEAGDSCACTVCVTPEQHASGALTLQMAVDLVRGLGGGTICLDVGNYPLGAPLDLGGARSLRIVGKGLASRLAATGRVIQIADAQDVRLEAFAVQCRPTDDVTSGAVTLASSREVVLERLRIAIINDNPAWAAVALRGALIDVAVRGCTLSGAFGVRSGDADGSETGLTDLRIDDNAFDCVETAVALGGVSVHQFVSRLRGNRVLRCRQAGFALTGAATPGHGVEISGNALVVEGEGIVAGIDGLRILDNVLLQAESADPKQQNGVLLLPGFGDEVLEACRILGNRIAGFHGAGVQARVPLLRALTIKQNRIERTGTGLVFESGLLEQVAIEDNQFFAVTGSALRAEGDTARLVTAGNQIETRSGDPAVLLLFATGESVFTHNQCRREGSADTPDVVLGADTLIVASNRVQGGGTSLDLHAGERRFTVVGNIAGGKIIVNGGGLPAPWAPLNLEGV